MAVEVPRRLLEKHNKAAPRYTSYPTVPAWSSAFGEADYREALNDLAARPSDDLSVYLHLPFCMRRCLYCGCNSVVDQTPGAVDRYLDHVERELGVLAGLIGTHRRVTQLHWGGGTPNHLRAPQLERTFGLLQRTFALDTGDRISLEVDPRIQRPGQAALLHRLGFRRISLGVQDFEPAVQQAIGRIQPRERTLELFAACREAGFRGVNLDLVYGLPAQTRTSFARTLETVIAMEPDRVACFSYAHVPWVRPEQKKIDATKLPDPFEKFALFQMATELFAQAGYEWIGLDHFARPDDPLAVALREQRLHRNFMGYTTRPADHMIALGMSGIGEVSDRFVQNDSDVARYQEALAAGRLPIVRGHRLSRDDRLRRMAILHLMCNLELPYALTVEEFGAPVNELLADEVARMRAYEAEGFLTADERGLRVTELGRFFIRNIAMELDAYLDSGGERPVFSKTI